MSQSGPQTLRTDNEGGCLAPMIYLVLLAAGLGMLYAFFLEPVRDAIASMNWVPTPCLIKKSQAVEASPKDKSRTDKSRPTSLSSTYRADIVYAYKHDGRQHTSGRIWFLKPSVDTKANIQDIISRYPAGSQSTCYVNPADPDEAVLERGLKPQLLIALVPLLMALIGAGGLASRLVSRIRPRPMDPSESAEPIHPAAISPPPAPLRRRGKRGILAVILSLVLATCWNGAVVFLVHEVASRWKHGLPACSDLLFTAFAIPFILVGLILALMPIYLILKLFNPRPTVQFSASAVPLGGSIDISWSFDGHVERISRLRITFEGREEAAYRRGTSTYTDRDVFRAIPLIDTTRPDQIVSGHVRLTIPPDTMHSFSSRHNKIIWALKMAGQIRRWPDVDQDFEVPVLPITKP